MWKDRETSYKDSPYSILNGEKNGEREREIKKKIQNFIELNENESTSPNSEDSSNGQVIALDAHMQRIFGGRSHTSNSVTLLKALKGERVVAT